MFNFDIPLISTVVYGYKIYCVYEISNRVYYGYNFLSWAYRRVTQKEEINENWTLL